jgi:uncharacterized protein YndB with AHSA1/START domain
MGLFDRTIHLEQHLDQPPERVWDAVSRPALIGAWFMRIPDAKGPDLGPVGERFTFQMPPQRGWDGLTHCEVLAIEPGRSVSVAYRGRASAEKTLSCAGVNSRTADAALGGIFTDLDTVLTFTVTPEASGSRLTLRHAGFTGLKAWIVSFVLGAGWGRVLRRLPPVLGAIDRGETPPLRP